MDFAIIGSSLEELCATGFEFVKVNGRRHFTWGPWMDLDHRGELSYQSNRFPAYKRAKLTRVRHGNRFKRLNNLWGNPDEGWYERHEPNIRLVHRIKRSWYKLYKKEYETNKIIESSLSKGGVYYKNNFESLYLQLKKIHNDILINYQKLINITDVFNSSELVDDKINYLKDSYFKVIFYPKSIRKFRLYL